MYKRKRVIGGVHGRLNAQVPLDLQLQVEDLAAEHRIPVSEVVRSGMEIFFALPGYKTQLADHILQLSKAHLSDQSTTKEQGI